MEQPCSAGSLYLKLPSDRRQCRHAAQHQGRWPTCDHVRPELGLRAATRASAVARRTPSKIGKRRTEATACRSRMGPGGLAEFSATIDHEKLRSATSVRCAMLRPCMSATSNLNPCGASWSIRTVPGRRVMWSLLSPVLAARMLRPCTAPPGQSSKRSSGWSWLWMVTFWFTCQPMVGAFGVEMRTGRRSHWRLSPLQFAPMCLPSGSRKRT